MHTTLRAYGTGDLPAETLREAGASSSRSTPQTATRPSSLSPFTGSLLLAPLLSTFTIATLAPRPITPKLVVERLLVLLHQLCHLL